MWQTATTIDPAAHRQSSSFTSSRRPSRLARRVPCRVRLPDEGARSGMLLLGHTVHVWRGGVAVQLARGIEPQTPVELQIVDGAGEIDTFPATVAYARRVMSGTYEIGLSLVGAATAEAGSQGPATSGGFGRVGMIHHKTDYGR